MPTAAAVHPHLTTAGIGAMKNPVTPHLNMATSSPVMMSRMLNISMRNRLCVLLRRTPRNVKKGDKRESVQNGMMGQGTKDVTCQPPPHNTL